MIPRSTVLGGTYHTLISQRFKTISVSLRIWTQLTLSFPELHWPTSELEYSPRTDIVARLILHLAFVKRGEPGPLGKSAHNATPLNLEEHTSRVLTSTVSGDVNLDRPMDTPTRVPIRRVVLCGERIPFLITWRTLRSTSRWVYVLFVKEFGTCLVGRGRNWSSMGRSRTALVGLYTYIHRWQALDVSDKPVLTRRWRRTY